MEHAIEHIFESTADRLWATYFFDDAYNEGLYDRLGVHLDDRSIQHEGAGPTLVVHRRLRFTARRGLSRLPAPFHSLMRGATSVVEHAEFSAQLRRFSMTLELPGILKIVECGGDYTWEALPGGHLRRLWRGRCESRLPLVGGRLARYLLGELEGSLAESYVYTCRWLREHPDPAVLAAPG